MKGNGKYALNDFIPRDHVVNPIRYNKHPRKKNNDLVAAMYVRYQNGELLASIGRVYRKSRQAVYDVFRTRGYQLRSKQLRGLQILDGYQFTEMKGGYLRGTVRGRRITMQQYVWRKHRGPVPAGYVIYHKDGNKQNNKITNLKLIALSDMSRTFNPEGHNQFTKDNGSITITGTGDGEGRNI